MWLQRLAFGFGGMLSVLLPGRFLRFLPDSVPYRALVVPFAIGAAIVVLRIVRGAQWRWLSYFVGLTVTWMTCLGALLAPSSIESWIKTRPFDAAVWSAAKPGRDPSRVWMVDDLLRRPVVGMKLADVDALLGRDDSIRGTGWGRGYWDDWDRVWWLGPQRGLFPIDSEWLVLRAASDGVVTEARLVSD